MTPGNGYALMDQTEQRWPRITKHCIVNMKIRPSCTIFFTASIPSLDPLTRRGEGFIGRETKRGDRQPRGERGENGFQQWPRVISNSTSRCNLMLVEKKKETSSRLVMRGLARRKSNQQLVRPLPERITLSRAFSFSSRMRRDPPPSR